MSDDPLEREDLSPEARACVENLRDPRWYNEHDDNGVDLSLIRANLQLTPTERMRRMGRPTTEALHLHARRIR